LLLIDYYQYYIFDLDGTIYIEDKLIDGALETYNLLTEKGKNVVFATNKTTETASDYCNFLKKNGFDVKTDQIITAGDVIKKFLIKNSFTQNIFLIGEDNFKQDLISDGFTFADKIEEISTVIVTLDRTFDYQKLEIAKEAIENGANFFAANIDNTYPTKSGEIIDAGSTIAALEKSTGKKLGNHFGKPSAFMIEEIKNRTNFINDKTVVIGDRPETDIQMGKIFGLTTILVNTGVKKRFLVNGENPKYRINSVKELTNLKLTI